MTNIASKKPHLKRGRIGALMLALLMILIGGVIRPHLVNAQEPTPAATPKVSACTQLLPLIQQSIQSSCNALDKNQVCYAHKSIAAEMADGGDKATFAKVGDIVPLTNVKSLTTAPYSSVSGDWGLAVLKIQAQVPNTTAGQAVTFILYGDTKIENATKGDSAAATASASTTPCTATTTRATSLMAQPGSNIVAKRLPADAKVIVQARNADSTWILAQAEDTLGWVKAANVKSDCDLTALPVTDPNQPSVMPALRAFYFSTSISGQATCEDAASGMMIQSQNGSQVSFNLNGADMTIGSTIVLKAIPHKVMSVKVIRGHATIVSKGKTETIKTRQKLQLTLGGDDGWDVESEPSDPEAWDAEDEEDYADACQLSNVGGMADPCDPSTEEEIDDTPDDSPTNDTTSSNEVSTEDTSTQGDSVKDTSSDSSNDQPSDPSNGKSNNNSETDKSAGSNDGGLGLVPRIYFAVS